MGAFFCMTWSKIGRRQILSFAFPGSLLGLYPDRVAIYTAEALTDAVVRIIPHQDLGPLLEEYPGIGLHLAWTAWRERNLAYDHLCSLWPMLPLPHSSNR
jgi:CRP-like cAMP-binding protein